MAVQVGTDLDFQSIARILNLPPGTDPNHPVTKAQLDAFIEGMAWKDNVRVRTASNISLASPGATLDGVTMVLNDRVLVAGQTAGAENGIYLWNGAAVPMTRASDANTATELLNATTVVDEGTSAGTAWRQSAVNITLGTTALAFQSFGTVAPPASEATSGIAEIATQAETDTGTDDVRIVTPLKLATWANRPRRFETTIGDGTATQFTVTHNLGQRSVQVDVFRNSGNYDRIITDVERTSTNAVVIRFAAGLAPAANSIRVAVSY